MFIVPTCITHTHTHTYELVVYLYVQRNELPVREKYLSLYTTTKFYNGHPKKCLFLVYLRSCHGKIVFGAYIPNDKMCLNRK